MGAQSATVRAGNGPGTRRRETARLLCLPAIDVAPKTSGAENFVRFARAWLEDNGTLAVFCASQSQADRVRYLCESKGLPLAASGLMDFNARGRAQIIVGSLSSGFRVPHRKLALLTDQDVFGQLKKAHKEEVQEHLGELVTSVEDLETGDLVVHTLHGIGRYLGLNDLKVDGAAQEFLLLEYQGG